METKISGRVWKFGDDVNTDVMCPGPALHLPFSEGVNYLFQAERDNWAEQVQPGDIVMAGRNFGTGSGRPVPGLFREAGIACVVAEEFNSLFFRNCINLGLPALEIAGVLEHFDEGDQAEVDVVGATVANAATGTVCRGEPLPQLALELLEFGGIMPKLESEGYLAAR